MRQNMAAAAVGRAAAADLGFGGAGERESEGGSARIRAAAAELPDRGGRVGSGEQASGSNWDREMGEGGARSHTHERMKIEHVFLFGFRFLPPFGEVWTWFRLKIFST
jgi:hypothetical protein